MTKRCSHISLLILGMMLATGADALTPLPPCDGEEGGMNVYGATPFGHADSGFVFETYHSLNTEDGVVAGADGPVEALNQFAGVRITECRTGKFIAIKGVSAHRGHDPLLATEFLRARDQGQQPFRFADVKRAAKALYGKDEFAEVTVLRETEETCGCDLHYPGAWK